jgi:hypothetical protein
MNRRPTAQFRPARGNVARWQYPMRAVRPSAPPRSAASARDANPGDWGLPPHCGRSGGAQLDRIVVGKLVARDNQVFEVLLPGAALRLPPCAGPRRTRPEVSDVEPQHGQKPPPKSPPPNVGVHPRPCRTPTTISHCAWPGFTRSASACSSAIRALSSLAAAAISVGVLWRMNSGRCRHRIETCWPTGTCAGPKSLAVGHRPPGSFGRSAARR